MKAKKLTPVESRLLDKIVDETWQNYEDEINRQLRARQKMRNGEPFEDFSYFLYLSKIIGKCFEKPILKCDGFFILLFCYIIVSS